MKVIWF